MALIKLYIMSETAKQILCVDANSECFSICCIYSLVYGVKTIQVFTFRAENKSRTAALLCSMLLFNQEHIYLNTLYLIYLLFFKLLFITKKKEVKVETRLGLRVIPYLS